MTIKKTCVGCKALICEHGTTTPYQCRMGYEIDMISGRPMTICPKPKTNMDYIKLNQIKNDYGLSLIELAKWKFK